MNTKNKTTLRNNNEWKIRCKNLYIKGSKEYKRSLLMADLVN